MHLVLDAFTTPYHGKLAYVLVVHAIANNLQIDRSKFSIAKMRRAFKKAFLPKLARCDWLCGFNYWLTALVATVFSNGDPWGAFCVSIKIRRTLPINFYTYLYVNTEVFLIKFSLINFISLCVRWVVSEKAVRVLVRFWENCIGLSEFRRKL